MLPPFSSYDARDLVPADAVPAAQRFLSGATRVELADSNHLRVRELRMPVPFTGVIRQLPATLAVAIARVVAIGTEEEMIGPDAGRVVATVANAEISREVAIGHQIHNAMGENEAFLNLRSATVPLGASIPSPVPAPLGPPNFICELFIESFPHPHSAPPTVFFPMWI